MMNETEKTTALVPSVGADGGQPLRNSTEQSIPDENAEINPPEEDLRELYRRMQRMTDPHYLHTISMTELYQTSYKSRPPIIDGLLYAGAYILAGAPKIGNRAMSEALGRDVYHYHLHVVYVPVVEKQIKWSTRCKDKSLIGTVKETIMQVSSSKKWLSKPAVDDTGAPLLTKSGKPVLRKSYSVLQDDFHNAMRQAGYNDVERGERGSSEEHLTVTQFKVEQEQARLTELVERSDQKEQQAAALDKKIAKIQKQQTAIDAVDQIEAKALPLSSKVILERSEYESLAVAAKKYVAQEKKESLLQKALDAAHKMIAGLEAKVAALTKELSEYKSVRNKLNTAGLEQENEALRGKLRSYESVIERNGLWHLFGRNKVKTHTRDDAR